MPERIIQQLCVSVSEHTVDSFLVRHTADLQQSQGRMPYKDCRKCLCVRVCLSVYVCVSVCLSVCSHPRSFYNDVIVRLATVSLMKRAVCVCFCMCAVLNYKRDDIIPEY